MHGLQERQATSSFRLLLVYRQSKQVRTHWYVRIDSITKHAQSSCVHQSPQIRVVQQEGPNKFITDPVFHLDVIYWHQDVSLEIAQVGLWHLNLLALSVKNELKYYCPA